MIDEAGDAFLRETRIAILTTLDGSGWPVSVPVWFEWDGSHARVFTNARSPKVARLKNDHRATLLVTNEVGQPEYWVAIDSEVEILEEGAAELSKRLAGRYWDMSDLAHQKSVDEWAEAAATLRVLELTPTKIRTYGS